MILVFRYRVKSNLGELGLQARAINFIWNYCNESQQSCLRLGKKWLTGFDLNKLTGGTSRVLGVHSGTINATCEQYAKSRRQKKRPYLRWRGVKSLGWVPFKGRDIVINRDAVQFNGRRFRVFLSRAIPAGARITDGGSFSADSRGRWYVNIPVEVPDGVKRTPRSAVGVDLGLKTLATLSNGEKVERPQVISRFADRLARAQRAHKRRLATAIYAKIQNVRRDFLHKLSTRLARSYDRIAVGNASPSKLAKTKMAKSVLDAGWSSLRRMLAYKAIRHGAEYVEVNESFSTQVCSRCGCLPDGRPRGIADLGIRRWRCGDCGAEHDRDVNAALNILHSAFFRLGHQTPAEGILAL